MVTGRLGLRCPRFHPSGRGGFFPAPGTALPGVRAARCHAGGVAIGTDEAAAAERVRRGRDLLEVAELTARYCRAVDGLAFDRLTDVFEPDAAVSYAWLPLGEATYRSVGLDGLDTVRSWLRASLTGRSELRRFVSNAELLAWSPTAAVVGLAMHERDMRISGRYTVHAVRVADRWRIRRLDLVEEIHWR